jgi:hypothetical protein
MAEIWNPFDADNPVYKDLAKQTAINNNYWRIAGSIAVLMIVADQAGKRGWGRRLSGVTGIGAYRNNPYGIIRK